MRNTKNLKIKTFILVLTILGINFQNYIPNFSQNLTNGELNTIVPRVSGWDPQILKTVGGNPTDMCVGDVNNDGYNDIVVVLSYSSQFETYIWDETVQDWESPITDGFGSEPQTAHIGDANNDGYNDIVVTERMEGKVMICIGQFNDYPVDYAEFTLGGEVYNAFIGDVNDDGYNDVVAVRDEDISIILWNDGLSDWDTPIFLDFWEIGASAPFWDSSYDVFIADINDDGVNEILVNGVFPDAGQEEISVIRWDEDDSEWQYLGGYSGHPLSVHAGDADNDGDNEILTVNFGNTATIHLTSSGSVTIPVGLSPDDYITHAMHLVSVGDVNNDGYNDVVTANYREHTVSILLWNSSSNNWDPQIKRTVGTNPVNIAIADVNNDGYLDIITANEGNGSISIILWNEPPILNIHEPFVNELFGNKPPEFNITVFDPEIDSMWYTLNGSTNYSFFSTNGTIDQEVWDDWNNGTVIIDFYANDTESNIGHAQQIVRKDIIQPIISVLSPSSNQQFIQVPYFNITVDQTDISSMWYTIDEGIHNYTMLDNEGFVDETAWSIALLGIIKIEFYVNDSLGNIGHTQKFIEKVEVTNSLNVAITSQVFTRESFNITFLIYNRTEDGINFSMITAWWNGIDVSSNVRNLGGGLYSISLTPIFVDSIEDPILLNMSISADQYEDFYFEIYLAVDEIKEEEPEPKNIGFAYFGIISLGLLGISIIILFVKYRKIILANSL